MAYQFGWFPRPKYRDLVFYVKVEHGMNLSLIQIGDTEENRAIMEALVADAALRARLEKAEETIKGLNTIHVITRTRAEKAEAEARQWKLLAEKRTKVGLELIDRLEKADTLADRAILLVLRTYWPMGDETQYAAKVQEIKALAGKGE